MHLNPTWIPSWTRSWRSATAAVLGTAVVAVAGLPLPATAAVTVGDETCLTTHQDAGLGGAAARGTLDGDRALDHAPVSAAQQARISARTDRILADQRVTVGSKQITVPVRVHVMAAKNGAGDVPDAQITDQIDVLNATYGGEESKDAAATGFRFVLKSTDRYYNNKWHRDGASKKYRKLTRIGTAKTLNMWLVEFEYLGIATFPWSYQRKSRIDGVRVHFDSLPGGSITDFNLGKTGTHEVGHWLGLFHTFQGGCARPGDEVRDTPAQRDPSSGCPEGNDTCPGKPGLDPIHNYMDYSTDLCYTQFTPGQKSRMRQMWRAYRG